MVTAQGQLRPVAGPAMATAGAGEPDLAIWGSVYSTTELAASVGTHRLPAGAMATSPGLPLCEDEMVTFGVNAPDFASCALVNSTTVSAL